MVKDDLVLVYNYESCNSPHKTLHKIIKMWEPYPTDGNFCPICNQKFSKIYPETSWLRLLLDGPTSEFRNVECQTCELKGQISKYNDVWACSLSKGY